MKELNSMWEITSCLFTKKKVSFLLSKLQNDGFSERVYKFFQIANSPQFIATLGNRFTPFLRYCIFVDPSFVKFDWNASTPRPLNRTSGSWKHFPGTVNAVENQRAVFNDVISFTIENAQRPSVFSFSVRANPAAMLRLRRAFTGTWRPKQKFPLH